MERAARPELLELTQHLMDLELEKKQYLADMNENIKGAKQAIKDFVKDANSKQEKLF
jgi:hypothetical protein